MRASSPVARRAADGRHVDAVGGRLPRESRPGATEPACSLERGREAAQSVLEHRARRSRVGRGEEREHEDVAVPEDVPAVCRPGQAAGTDGRLAAVAGRADQVEEREANRPLELWIAFDDDVGLRPPASPGLPVLAEQALEAGLLGRGECEMREALLRVVRAEPLEGSSSGSGRAVPR